jgi:hypothetical protein
VKVLNLRGTEPVLDDFKEHNLYIKRFNHCTMYFRGSVRHDMIPMDELSDFILQVRYRMNSDHSIDMYVDSRFHLFELNKPILHEATLLGSITLQQMEEVDRMYPEAKLRPHGLESKCYPEVFFEETLAPLSAEIGDPTSYVAVDGTDLLVVKPNYAREPFKTLSQEAGHFVMVNFLVQEAYQKR